MNKSMGAASLLLGALLLSGCKDTRQYCYGIEPDGEVETLSPCPVGWRPNQTKPIREDEFKNLEIETKRRKSTR